jgi:hypothetical protein
MYTTDPSRAPRAGGAALALVGLPPAIAVAVGIDIKPGASENSINLTSQGKVPVAILSTTTFDATAQVDRTSLTFGRTGVEARPATAPSAEDVNGDGRLDLIYHFDAQTSGFLGNDVVGVLKGKMTNGAAIEGRDAIRIVP